MTDYEAHFELLMPGATKPSHFIINVKNATNNVEAMAMAIEDWKRITEPKDVRVREVQKVVSP